MLCAPWQSLQEGDASVRPDLSRPLPCTLFSKPADDFLVALAAGLHLAERRHARVAVRGDVDLVRRAVALLAGVVGVHALRQLLRGHAVALRADRVRLHRELGRQRVLVLVRDVRVALGALRVGVRRRFERRVLVAFEAGGVLEPGPDVRRPGRRRQAEQQDAETSTPDHESGPASRTEDLHDFHGLEMTAAAAAGARMIV